MDGRKQLPHLLKYTRATISQDSTFECDHIGLKTSSQLDTKLQHAPE